MIYDVYEVRHMTSDEDYDILEWIHQPTEPMYDSMALIAVIKKRVSNQTGFAEDELKVVSMGQSEKVR